MCKETRRKYSRHAAWFQCCARFKGALLDGATSPFASQASARRKVGVRKALSWDWRHPPHSTLLLCYLAIAGFIFLCFSHSHCYQVGRDTTPSGGQRGPHSTHTRALSLPKEIKDAIWSAKNKDQLAVAWLAGWSFDVYFNGSLTPEKNATANVSFMERADSVWV